MSSIVEIKEGNCYIKGNQVMFTDKKENPIKFIDRNKINDLENLIKYDGLKNEGMICIYDGQRPCLPKKTIKKTITAANKHNSAMSMLITPETLKLVDQNNFVKETLDRRKYANIQLRAIKNNLLRKMSPAYNLLKKIDENIKKYKMIRTKKK